MIAGTTNEPEEPFRIAQTTTIRRPKELDGYAVPCHEWEHIKDRIRKLGRGPLLRQIFATAGSVLIGSSLATFIGLLLGVPDKAVLVLPAKIITGSLLFAGLTCFGCAMGIRHQITVDAEDLLFQFRLIEERHTTPDTGHEGQARSDSPQDTPNPSSVRGS